MGWIAFFVLGVPIVGMGVASITGSERLVWIFGLLLMLAAPLWFFIAIIAKIVRHLKK
ncbi:hypothetical protein SAMN05518865_12116 [Duganella sp. CF458]|nr:hypothetical protein SAMN05518865_12116 [Duganella sp. CF458]